MVYDKLNFVYYGSMSACSSYQLEEGLSRELIKRDVLYLNLDLWGNRYSNHWETSELQRYPILVSHGWYPHFDHIFGRLTTKHILIETESKLLANGKKYEFNAWQEKFAPKCQKIFTHCELDVDDYFGMKAEFLPIFIDTNLYREYTTEKRDQILLPGNLYGDREKIFDKFEWKRIMTRGNTPYRQSALLQSIDHAQLISRYRFIWAPATQSRTFGGKWFQGAACKRLVFIERDPNCPLMHSIVKDRVHAVYYETPAELEGCYYYYLQHPDEERQIVENAYKLVTSRFTIKRAVDQILQSLKRDGILDDSISEVKGEKRCLISRN